MDWATILSGVFTLLVPTAATGTVAFIMYRRQHPKRRIRYSFSQSTLLNVTNERIQVLVEGSLIHNAYSTTLNVYSDSRADIPSSAFDANRPLTFDFGDDIVVAAPSSHSFFNYRVKGSAIQILPQLIRKRTGATLTLIHGGRARICIIENPLVDIEVEGGSEQQFVLPHGNRLLVVVFVATGLLALGTVALLVATLLFDVL